MPPTDPPIPPARPSAPRSHFNNWITAIGVVIAVGALFSFALLVWMDFTQDDRNPYLGIFTYLVAPGFLLLGLALIFFGAWAQRRWALRHTTFPDKWQLDFSNPRQRRNLVLFAVGAAGFIMLSAFGSYQTYHYSESTLFCGQVCHEAMNPEWVTYQRGSHARVACVECHVGEGAQWFFKAKLNGAHQLLAYTLDNYNRPIETPIKNLRPAQDTCEKCHWPAKFHGNVEMIYTHFLSNRQNAPYTLRMLMHVNETTPGAPEGGIHWHVNPNNRVEYYATDEDRQEIPWVRVTDVKAGTSKVFRTDEFKGDPPAGQIRTMDCMDCHNRPAHAFPTANDAVEHAMAAGALSRELPGIKRVAVQAMSEQKIATTAEAPEKIAAFMREKYNSPEHAPHLEPAIRTVQELFATSIFPERKADWRQYPNNIGHKDWLGCFRCHDNNHKTPAGQTVRSSDCSSCHTIIAQGAGPELQMFSAKGLEFKHPSGDLDADLTCADCHNGGIQK